MPLTFKNVKPDPELAKLGIHFTKYKKNYQLISKKLLEFQADDDDESMYELMRKHAIDDYFFLIYFVLDININHPFLIQRCYDVQEKHTGTLDLWAREHYKSTILTHALCIWKWIHDPEKRIVIFSHTRGLAKGHLRRVKQILELNRDLKHTFPEIFYKKPKTEAFKWSENDGIYIKRKGVYKDASLEAWGLVDGQPTGSHFTDRIYDDIIEVKSVSTSAQKEKLLEAFRLSDNLGATNIIEDTESVDNIVGTRYDFTDPYVEIIKEGGYEVRIFPAEVDEKGNYKLGGKPVMMTRETLDKKCQKQGHYIYHAQMLQYPLTGQDRRFNVEWLQYYDDLEKLPHMNYHIIVDPARRKGEKNDYTVMWVIGVDNRRVRFAMDCVRDKLELHEKWEKLRDLVQHWGVNDVGYESNANDDAEYMRYKMSEEGVFFNIIDIHESGNKPERIRKLLDPFMKRRIAIPRILLYNTIKGEMVDLIKKFIKEYLDFPAITNDDLMDSLQKTFNIKMPIVYPTTSAKKSERDEFDPLSRTKSGRSRMEGWM